MYAGIAFIGLIIFYQILPETKGKTLEEMGELFTNWAAAQVILMVKLN